MSQNHNTHTLNRIKFTVIRIVLLGLIFSAVYTISPLYSSNQNTYFSYGLARSGFGELSRDWFASTTDPFPLFSLLVAWTYSVFGQLPFYLYFILLCGVYITSLMAIVTNVCGLDSKRERLAVLAIILAIHSRVVGEVLFKLLHLDITHPLYFGLADQYSISTILEPASFSVFFFASIAALLSRRYYAGVITACIAAWFHNCGPYIAIASFLCIIHIIAAYRDGSRKDIIPLTLLWIGCIIPPVCYALVKFAPTSAWNEASAILALRLKNHANPEIWLHAAAWFQIALIGVGLLILQRTRLFPAVALVAAFGAVFTIIQIVTDSNTLALAFPWRVSTILVPLSTCIVVGSIVRWLLGNSKKYARFKAGYCLVLIAILSIVGIAGTAVKFQRKQEDPARGVMKYARRTATAQDTYLVPTSMEKFRLWAGVPIFVDIKSVPFKDTEVLEWNYRIKLAKAFYADSNTVNEEKLVRLSDKYKITHVVLPAKTEPGSLLKTVYSDSNFKVCVVSANQ